MLRTLYPASFRRYSSLAIFGPIVDGFSAWLVNQHYDSTYLRQRIWLLPYIEAALIRRGIRRVAEIRPEDWVACRRSLFQRFPDQAGTTFALERYLHAHDLLKPPVQTVAGTADKYLTAYAHFLETVCGVAASTLQQNSYTASKFLTYLKIESHPRRLNTLTPYDLDAFIKWISHRLSRTSLRCIAVRLRSFLRFLAVKGEIPPGLDRQIDTPRIYREEQLPAALPWETVRTLLDSIDRSSLVGLRDFTMFFLMAIYGLRASDVVALTLDNIHWRARKISISQRKTGTVLELPLTDEAGAALHAYLRKAPPPPPFRQIFLSANAPIRTLKTTAISTAFRVWARRSGVEIPGRGACHRIRHSYAVFLLRKGTQVKTIGDILGHRTLESTWTYLRLSLEDLRDVALPVPKESNGRKAVRS